MELKRSLEKAKQQEGVVKPLVENKLGDISSRGGNAENSGHAGTGWTPPVYSQSSAAQPDMELLRRNHIVCTLPESPEAEHYKILRTNIQRHTRAKNWNTIMITSARPGEGKTLTSINLSVSFAKEFNQTVLLVDCDFHRQSVCKYLGISSDNGISDYLLERLDLKDLIIWPNIEKFTFISGGRTITDTSELLGSPRMKNMVDEIKQRYKDRIVIFDVPPVLAGADAIAFAPLVDCYLMVVEEGSTSIQEINMALEMLPKEKFLGFVLNKRKNVMSQYYY
jgi:protein-tyrosine kinase